MITDSPPATALPPPWLCDYYPGPHGCGGGAWQHGCTLCGKQKQRTAPPPPAPPGECLVEQYHNTVAQRCRQRHVVSPDTAQALAERRNSGLTLRALAVALGYTESYASTLSHVIRRTPGCITVAGEAQLRQALGLPLSPAPAPPLPLPRSPARRRPRYLRPCLSPDPATRIAQLEALLVDAKRQIAVV